MWRDWFIFSKRDSRAMLFLLLCLAVLLVVRWLSGTGQTGVGADVDTLAMHDVAEVLAVDRTVREVEAEEPAPVLVPFDPNTADSALLAGLGVPRRVVANMLKYRAAGGVFRDVQSLRKIYGMSDEVYSRISPYVVIASTPAEEESVPARRFPASDKLPYGSVVDLNSADTALLKRIPGIGSYRASRIVRLRSSLGGFVSVSQLSSIKGMPDSLQHWFRIDSGFSPVRIPVNTASYDVLAAHPCISRDMARVITRHIRLHGPVSSLDDFRLYSEFDSCDVSLLSRYLDFGL